MNKKRSSKDEEIFNVEQGINKSCIDSIYRKHQEWTIVLWKIAMEEETGHCERKVGL